MSKHLVLNGRWLFRLALILGLVSNATALQISRLSNTNLWVDFTLTPPAQCNYVAYQITNNDGVAYSNLWVTIGSFTGSVVSLGGGDPGKYNVGALPVNGSKPVFFYLAATNATTISQTHTISIYQGYPSVGTVLLNSNFSLTVGSLRTTGQNKQSTASYAPTNPILGSIVVLTVDGSTGPLKNGDLMLFTPASVTNWGAYAFQVASTSITVTNGASTYLFTNVLSFGQPGSQGSVSYHAQYWLRAVAVTPGATPTSPDGAFATGNNSTLEHSIVGAGVVLPSIQPPTNATLLAKSANLAQLYTNQTVTYSLSFTNGSTSDLSLDRIVDTLPTNFSIISGSSSFGGSSLGNPILSGRTLTWSDGYTVPAGSSRSLVFQALANVGGRTTNSAVGFTLNSQIDTTLTTTDNVPATVSVRVLQAPTAVNDSATTLEDTLLTVSAPGVLSNDIEPNGFTLSVVTSTQPAHGTVTVNANGSFTYMPTTNFNGSDSFTYTITNGNAGSATATVNLTVVPVNDPPSFTKGPDQTILEDAGPQTVLNWATNISAGPPDESGQTLTFHVSNNNSSLFSVQPTVSSNGTLTYTTATNANGSATVTIYLQDNGGTANGGSDTSPTNTFIITVIPVNDPPSFTKGPDQTVSENAGAQTVPNWANSISAGPPDEAGQTLTFHLSNNNNSLFSTQPVVASNGTLTFTPATNASGSAVVTIYLQDNGGTANGGSDTSPTNTFNITVLLVNHPPTLNAISNLTIFEGGGSQTVNLSGISPGPANESGQTLTLTATSSDTTIIPNPTANYTNGNSTGSLTFTPVSNALGTATISVVLHDNGGTSNGGIDTITNIFTVTVLPLTNVWNTNGVFAVTVNDALGQPGLGYTQTNYIGFLDVQATTNAPFTIQLLSSAGGFGGVASNFNNNSNFTWTIATTTRGELEFDPSKFIVGTTGFSNDLAGGTFSVNTNGSNVTLVFNPNHPPVALPILLGRAWGTSMRIPLPSVLTNYTSDPDGDPTAFSGFGFSTNGSSISTNSIFLLFVPSNNFPESFAYTVHDVRYYRPGDTIRTATNWVTIAVTNAVSSVTSLVTSGGSATLQFAGVPGYAYDVQRASSLVGPWMVILTTNAPPHGLWIYTDPSPPQPTAFYRLQQH